MEKFLTHHNYYLRELAKRELNERVSGLINQYLQMEKDYIEYPSHRNLIVLSYSFWEEDVIQLLESHNPKS